MPLKPPSFGSQQYWDTRFTANPSPFEWLESPTALDPFLTEALNATGESDPQLLHIGCGTSLLSYHLRAHVRKPEQIHNLDYSEVAVEVGQRREVELYNPKLARGEGETKVVENGAIASRSRSTGTDGSFQQETVEPKALYMRWSTANLLDHSSLLRVCQPSTYTLVIDKSTSDCIACSDDLYVPLPYHVTTPQGRPSSNLTESTEPIHPLHIMAIHLALVTKPKGRWISLSYSMERYPFLRDSPIASSSLTQQDDLDNIPKEIIDGGFPNPSLLWRLVGKYAMEAPPPAEPSNGQNGLAVVHRPKVMHWIYVLERTHMQLVVQK
jgi:hypothetical protein